VLARWLATRPRVLLLDEPTRGVDVGAKYEIHGIVRRMAAEGAACLVVSSDLPEVLALADRILVMREGRLQGEIAAKGASEERVMHLATHESQSAA
jgi:ABC-type sugar transport system ATPase subunit